MKTLTKGYTLIELVISIAILGILYSGAILFTSPLSRANQSSRLEHFFSSLNFARATAISEQRTLTFCTSDDTVHCLKTASHYLLIFNDKNNNKIAESTEILRVSNIHNINARVTISVSGGRHYIRFRSDGTAKDFGRITICPNNASNHYADELILNYGGRLRIAKDKDKNGIVEGKNGNDISC